MVTQEPLDEDEMLMAESFNEKHLTLEERKAFSDAKDAAALIENSAWKAVPESEAKEGEVVPAGSCNDGRQLLRERRRMLV